MNNIARASKTFHLRNVLMIFFAVLALTAVFTLTQQAQAAVNCSNNNWTVASEADFNSAIACYNAKTTPGNYTITLTQNINLTASSTPIYKAGSFTLTVDGAGFTINGQEIFDVIPFAIEPSTTAQLQNITITGGGRSGIYNRGTLTVNNSTIVGNMDVAGSGGGIVSHGALSINNSTVANNLASDSGGGIYNLGILTINNSTISGNSVTNGNGGAIYSAGENASLTINSSTIVNHKDVGIYNIVLADLTISNSIIANNTLGDCYAAGGGTLTDGGHNIIEDDRCFHTHADGDPRLGPLRDNGGPTDTHALIPGSPAIDAGNTALTTDQRGNPRPTGAADDIGAFELEAHDCTISTWTVANAVQLNNAIACYNNKTTAGNYKITFSQNISPTFSTYNIVNTTNGIALTVDGAGFAIDGQGITNVRPFTINENTTAIIQNITIRGGNAQDGGGIFNQGTLTVNNSTLSGNSTSNQGGGIYNQGTLSVNNSTLSGNSASSQGGGISSDAYLKQVRINNTILTNNSAGSGGGIGNFGSNLIVSKSTLTGNSASIGGGIYNGGTLSVNNSTLTGNSASNKGGGIDNGGTLSVNNSTLSDNSATQNGGGIYNGGILTVNSNTLSGNSASNDGGGIYNQGTLNVNNSTLSGNSASNKGGGIYNNSGNTTLNNDTLAENSAASGGGIYNWGEQFDAYFNLYNTIIANSNGGDCIAIFLPVEGVHNIIEDNSCGFTGGDPMLGPLQDNGGPTFTHALLPGSPAIDKGDSELAADQRGAIRPQGLADDIGAVEFGNVFPAVYLPIIIK